MASLCRQIRDAWARVGYGTKVIVIIGLAGGAWQGWVALLVAVLMGIALIAVDLRQSKTS